MTHLDICRWSARIGHTVGFFALAAAAACTSVGHVATGESAGPFSDVGTDPRPFAPHLWKPDEEVHGGTFTADSRTFYFFKKVGPDEDFRIVVSRWSDGAWSAPEPVSFSTTTSDLYPAVSGDGNRIVFTSYRRVPGDTAVRPNAHLWMVERHANAWREPVPLSSISSLGDYHPGTQMLPNGTLYFRVISNHERERATYRAAFDNGSYPRRERVVAFDLAQRDSVRVWDAQPTPDEQHFFLSVAPLVRAPSTYGPADIFVVRRLGNEWGPRRLLPPSVNTAASEGAVTVTPDGRHLVFNRSGRLYVVAIAGMGIE